MKSILNFRTLWICMVLMLCFFAARIINIAADMSELISELWK